MKASNFPRMHVSLYVSDLAATVNFYSAFFGQPAAKVRKGYAKYLLDQPSLIISFLENPERVQANFGHLGFQVETKEEMERLLATAKAQGLVQKEEIGTACCYAVQDKFWVTDPDGVQWEVYYFHADAEFNDPHYEQTDASACCLPPAHAEQATKTVAAEKPQFQMLEMANTACTPGGGCC